MRRSWAVAFLLVIAMTFAVAQGPRSESANPSAAANPMAELTKAMSAPGGFFDKFWDDPATVEELKLTAEQKRQLREASTKLQLALIDQGADAFKALVMLGAITDAEELDNAAYNKQLDGLSAATGKIIRQIGEMVIAPRRILTAVQYQKLKSLQKARREAVQTAHPAAPGASGSAPHHVVIPPSLQGSR